MPYYIVHKHGQRYLYITNCSGLAVTRVRWLVERGKWKAYEAEAACIE